MKIYQIYGASYDGCNGWSTWACKGLIYKDKQKAIDKLNKMNKNSYSRFTIKEIEIE